ncbi:MAG: hypothetical protein EXR72_14510 [Myxococcales bacterium]|nr:hypothetical protein [Myxococcales bacterium]
MASRWAIRAILGIARLCAAGDPDREAARRHFQAGSLLFDQGRYADAIAEFEVARGLVNLPAFDYNIARGHEYLEHWDRAADAYERFLAASPGDPDALQLRARVGALRLRAGPRAPATVAVPAPAVVVPGEVGRSLRVPALAVGIFALASAAVGTALVGSVSGDFSAKQTECEFRRCVPSDWANLERRANAGYSLWVVAGVVAVVDVALWVIDARRRRSRPRASIAPRFSGLTAEATF